MNLKSGFYMGMALMLAGVCRAESTATAPLFRLETRESFGGRLAYGQTALSATADGVHTGSVAGAGASGSFTIWAGGAGSPVWDTAQRTNGWYALTLTTATNTLAALLAVLNGAAVVVREGTLTDDASWTSNAVQVVRHWVVVPPGRTLTLGPGSVVKFTDNTGIQVNTGGVLNVRGAVLTHVADDTVGGDTNMDGSQTQPTAGEWIAGGGMPSLARVGFDAQGGAAEPSRVFTAGQVYGWLPVPVRAGYAFGGWFTAAGGGGTRLTESATAASGTLTLYALWSLEQVATPVISPTNGTVFTTSSKRVTITCATTGAEIRFTTNGVDPTVSSPLYSGSFNIYATTTVKARAFKTDMTASDIAIAVITKPIVLTLADALELSGSNVVTGGHAVWTVQTAVSHDGVDAACSGSIGASQSTWMETSVSGAGTLTFWWRASCEDSPDNTWDFLSVTVDGLERARIDGESGWQQVSVTLSAGTHTVRWTYTKDDYDETVNSDCGWVDQVAWTPASSGTTTTDVSVPYAWLDQFGLVTGGDYETAAQADLDGDGLTAWQEYVAGTVPTNAASVFIASIVFSNGMPYVVWTPDMGTQRLYTVEGKAVLTDTIWTSPTNAASRFFRVKVSPR